MAGLPMWAIVVGGCWIGGIAWLLWLARSSAPPSSVDE